MKHWQPAGTVYGCLLNFQREWDLWAPRMAQDPYKGPPRAPVLYVKSANTFNPSGSLLLQDGVQEVDIGATLSGMPSLSIMVQLNGQKVQTVHLSELVRPVDRLLADVGEFMSLQAGDVLMLGTDVLAQGQRPRARAGDTVCLTVPGFAPWVQTVQGEAV